LKDAYSYRVRALANIEAFQQSRRERKKVEMRFCAYEVHSQARPVSDAGLERRRDEVPLTATAQNLRRLARILCRVSPPLAVTCPA